MSGEDKTHVWNTKIKLSIFDEFLKNSSSQTCTTKKGIGLLLPDKHKNNKMWYIADETTLNKKQSDKGINNYISLYLLQVKPNPQSFFNVMFHVFLQ